MSKTDGNVFINKAVPERMPHVVPDVNLAEPLMEAIKDGLIQIDGCLIFRDHTRSLEEFKAHQIRQNQKFDRSYAEWFTNKLTTTDWHPDNTLDYAFGFLKLFKNMYPADPENAKYLLISDSINHPDIVGPDGDFYPNWSIRFHIKHEGEEPVSDHVSIEHPYNANCLEIW